MGLFKSSRMERDEQDKRFFRQEFSPAELRRGNDDPLLLCEQGKDFALAYWKRICVPAGGRPRDILTSYGETPYLNISGAIFDPSPEADTVFGDFERTLQFFDILSAKATVEAMEKYGMDELDAHKHFGSALIIAIQLVENAPPKSQKINGEDVPNIPIVHRLKQLLEFVGAYQQNAAPLPAPLDQAM